MKRFWRREAGDPDGPPVGSFSWSVTPQGETACAVTVLLVRRIPDAFPHLLSVVLHGPVSGVEASTHLVYAGVEPGTQNAYRGTYLHVPVRNLQVGGSHTVELPVPAESVGALVFGSLTTLGWAENDHGAVWLVNRARDERDTLHSWMDEIGSDPLMRVQDLVLTPAPTLRPAPDHPDPEPRSRLRDELDAG